MAERLDLLKIAQEEQSGNLFKLLVERRHRFVIQSNALQ